MIGKNGIQKKQDKEKLVQPEINDNKENRRNRIFWSLGEFSADAGEICGLYYGKEPYHPAKMMMGEQGVSSEVVKSLVNFGGYISGNLYYLEKFEGA